MKLIESKVELIKQEPGLEGIYKQIELAGRTCYKSENKITYNSSVDFVKKMEISMHTAMLEHGTVYLKLPPVISANEVPNSFDFMHNPYSKVVVNGYDADYVTTNYRVLVENNWTGFLKYLCEPTEFHERRITLKFTTDRGVSHELVRHRVFSFAQESTRYCNYSKDKFGKEITFIKPSWYTNDNHEQVYTPMITEFEYSCISAEHLYFNMLAYGAIPQQARQVLPNALKTDIVMTGFASDWKHFFDLRLLGTTGKPHPDMLLLAEKAKKVLDENNLWLLIYNQNERN